jgi:hypothetical protein
VYLVNWHRNSIFVFTTPGTPNIFPGVDCQAEGNQVTCNIPPEEQCAGQYDRYALGASGTAALFLGLTLGGQVGYTLPREGGLRGMQFFVTGQGAGMLGLGGFLGWGPTFSSGINDGVMPSFNVDAGPYAEIDAGWGHSVSVSFEGDQGGRSITAGVPVPRVGQGYGLYGGVGASANFTIATRPALCS